MSELKSRRKLTGAQITWIIVGIVLSLTILAPITFPLIGLIIIGGIFLSPFILIFGGAFGITWFLIKKNRKNKEQTN